MVINDNTDPGEATSLADRSREIPLITGKCKVNTLIIPINDHGLAMIHLNGRITDWPIFCLFVQFIFFLATRSSFLPFFRGYKFFESDIDNESE